MSYPIQTPNKPVGISIRDWKIALKKAQLVNAAFEKGQPWNTDLFINSKEFFELISTEDGRIMIGKDATLKFGNNQNISNWKVSLQDDAVEAIENENFNKAETLLATWRLIEPQNPEMQVLLGLVYFKQNKNLLAWKTLTRIINENPEMDKALYIRAVVLQKVAKLDETLEDLNLYLRKQPADKNAIYLKTKVLIGLGRTKQAAQFAEKVYAQTSSFFFGRIYIETLIRTKQYNKAEMIFSQLAIDGEKSASKAFQLAQLAKMARLESEFWKFLYFAKEKGHPKAKEMWMQITKRKENVAA